MQYPRQFQVLSVVATVACVAAGAFARAPQAAPAVIDWPGMQVPPLDPALAPPPAPAPLSARIQGAFTGEHWVYLDGPTAADILLADIQDLAANNNRPGPERVGIVRMMPNGGVDSAGRAVRQTPLDPQRSMWTVAVQSGGAFALRVQFSGVDLGDCSLIVYSWSKRSGVIVAGPFTGFGPNGNGEFWTRTLPGEKVFIEVIGRDQPRFTISKIAHFDKDPAFGTSDGGSNGGGVANCHLDARCHGMSTEVPRNATGQMNIIDGDDVGACTGTLLNDQDAETTVPYFITAFHCLSTQTLVTDLEVVWQWERNTCDGSLPDYFTLPRNTGGTLVATSPTSTGNDMTFIRLAGAVQPGVALAGWTTATGLSAAWGFHHPSGSWKRYTYFNDVGICPVCVCEDPAEFDYYQFIDGLVEGGSSGSGIFNSSGQLAGQLLGRCSNHTSDDMTCSNFEDFKAMYGEFQETYPLISTTLAIGGTMHVNWAAPFNGTGTPGSPFKFVNSAHNAAWNGVRIKISAGSYDETLTANKAVTLIANGGTVTIGQ